jgi:diguanylate cyclase (GGDEF)-like protein
VISGDLPRTRALVIIFNFLNFILLSLIAYGWFMYMAASENMILGKTWKQRRLVRLPMEICTAILVITYIIAPRFWVNDAGELNFWYYPLLLTAPLIYIISSFVCSMINAKKAENRETKRLYILIGVYPLSVVFFGLLQLIALNAPLFCFGCTIMMLFFYIQSMQTLISVDALTRLNNRGQIERYMKQVRYRENLPVYAAMIDIDHFKKINDTFGHAEGDRALVLVAEAMRQTAEKSGENVFIGRYGGDEFTMIVQSAKEGIMEEITDRLREAAHHRQEENHLFYNLDLSIGYDRLRGGEDTMDACLNRADEKLYENKRAAGTDRR